MGARSAVLEELSSPAVPVEAGRRLNAAWLRARRLTWPIVTRRRLVVALGLLWTLDGVLQVQPYMYSRSGDSFAGAVLQYNTMGKPNPLTDLIHFAVVLTYGTPGRQFVFNTLAAVLQLLLGALLVSGRLERTALLASCAWGVVPWLIGEGLGGMAMPQSSMFIVGAPGAAVLYSILSLTLWPRPAYQESVPRPVAEEGLLRARGACWLWAAIWVATGLLELEHANWAPNAIAAQLRNNASGQPGWLAAVGRAAAAAATGRGTSIALALAVAQVLVGWWALRSSTRRLALGTGIALSVLYWVVGQNLGDIFTGQGTDPNLGPVMLLFALALWPRARAEVPTRPVHVARWRSPWMAGLRHLALAGVGTVLFGAVLVGAARGIATTQAADRAAVVGEPGTGTVASDGQFTTLSGATENLSRVRRPMLLWFVATWCGSCQSETTTEVSRLRLLRRRDIHVVELDLAGDLAGLSQSDTLAAMRQFVRPYAYGSLGSTWTWGVASSALTRSYDPKGNLDQFYLVDSARRIVARGQDPTVAVP